jgi:hypothetical protein
VCNGAVKDPGAFSINLWKESVLERPPMQEVYGLNVRATQANGGPDICIGGEGFTPGATLTVQYIGVPKTGASHGIQVVINSMVQVGADGKFNLFDTSQVLDSSECTFPAPDPLVQVRAVENGSNITATGSLPSAFWCTTGFPMTFNGGCP